MWSRLNNVVFILVEASLDILRLIVINLLDVMTNDTDFVHEGVSELLVHNEPLLVVADSESGFFSHGVRVEKTCTGEAWKIFTVGVTTEDESGSSETKGLVRVTVDLRLLRLLVVTEANGLTRHVGHKSFTKTQTGFDVNFVVITVGGIGCVNDISVFSTDNSLNKNGHEDLMQSDTKLFGSEECSLVELTSPNSLDRVPSLVKLSCRNSELDKFRLEVLVMRIILLEVHTEDDFFASKEVLVHFLNALADADLLNKIVQLLKFLWLKCNRIILELERNRGTLWKFDSMIKLVSQGLKVVGFTS